MYYIFCHISFDFALFGSPPEIKICAAKKEQVANTSSEFLGQFKNLPLEFLFAHNKNPCPSYQSMRICSPPLLINIK